MGVLEDIEVAMETDGGDAPAPPEKKYLIDTVYMKHPRKGMDLVSFLRDGMGRWTGGVTSWVGRLCCSRELID